jgi:hypothetical protein
MKLAAVVVVFAGSATFAHAATLDEYGPGVAPRPASQLSEAACDVDVELRGPVAVVEVRQRLVNSGPQPLAAIHDFTLPAGAVVTGLSVGGEPALVVPAGFKTAEVESADVLGADPAVLRKQDDGVYELIIQPIPADHDVVVTTRYTALAAIRAGALHLALPAHAGAGKLTACKGTLRVAPGPGATVQRIRVDGATAGTRTAAPFTVDAIGVTLDVELEVAGNAPVVWAQTQPLADGWSASLVSVLAPRVKATIPGAGARRVVLVIDGSRSMDLVGRHNVGKVVHALGSALPAGAEVEAILYDRTATRVFGDVRAATPQNLAVIEDAVAKRGASNGSDLVRAFELAKHVVEGARGQAMVIVVTDGVTGELPDNALITALSAKIASVDVHAIVLDPAHTRSPGAKVLHAPVNLYGGGYVEVGVDELDDALVAIDSWMRPSWLELGLGGKPIPSELRGGAGFTQLVFHKAAARFTLTGHSEAPIAIAARSAPAAPIAALALSVATPDDVAGFDDPNDAQTAAASRILDHAHTATPIADADRALAVIATTGRIAKNRRAMIAGGGRYERMVAIADPARTTPFPTGPAPVPSSAIARITLERIFRDQLQPKAYACYGRALGKHADLAGTAHFTLRMGRGEVTQVQLVGLGDPDLDACLLDAAYALTPPLPDFTINADDQTLATYPLTFKRREDQPYIVLGDADSTSPLDIDAIEGGVPGKPKAVKVNAATPLGNLRPTP